MLVRNDNNNNKNKEIALTECLPSVVGEIEMENYITRTE